MANNHNDKNRNQADKSGAGKPNIDDLRQNPDHDQNSPHRQQQAEQGKQGQQGTDKNDPNHAKQHGADNMKQSERR
jgi:hypothetical protein